MKRKFLPKTYWAKLFAIYQAYKLIAIMTIKHSISDMLPMMNISILIFLKDCVNVPCLLSSQRLGECTHSPILEWEIGIQPAVNLWRSLFP